MTGAVDMFGGGGMAETSASLGSMSNALMRVAGLATQARAAEEERRGTERELTTLSLQADRDRLAGQREALTVQDTYRRAVAQQRAAAAARGVALDEGSPAAIEGDLADQADIELAARRTDSELQQLQYANRRLALEQQARTRSSRVSLSLLGEVSSDLQAQRQEEERQADRAAQRRRASASGYYEYREDKRRQEEHDQRMGRT